jgi:signal transduction histidine kinase
VITHQEAKARHGAACRYTDPELGGTGLGLAIVKHIAQLHGGRVEAESELGKGCTIRVALPREMTNNE